MFARSQSDRFFLFPRVYDRSWNSLAPCSANTTCAESAHPGSLLQWFENYLTNRTQRVVLSGSSSTSLPVQSGVPQGSILDPLLFLIYINPLAEVHLSPGSSLILYADDILLYRPIVNKHDHVLLQQDVDLIARVTHQRSDTMYSRTVFPGVQNSVVRLLLVENVALLVVSVYTESEELVRLYHWFMLSKRSLSDVT